MADSSVSQKFVDEQARRFDEDTLNTIRQNAMAE